MKVNDQLEESLLDNAQRFSGDFFRRFKLRPASEPLELREDLRKDYLFPTLYADVTCAMGVFLCSYAAAQALMPRATMKPVSMLHGRALAIFSSYVYRHVLGMKPYNEIAMTIPVMTDALIVPPLLPILISRFARFGYYVFSMPVTSLENRIRGQRIWGLPKEVQRIDIATENEFCKTTAYTPTGEPYLELDVATTGRRRQFDMSANLYSERDGELLQSATCFQGEFRVNQNFAQLFRQSAPGDGKALRILSKSPEAEQLRALQIQPVPFQTRYAASMNSCFDLPNPDLRAPGRRRNLILSAISRQEAGAKADFERKKWSDPNLPRKNNVV